MILFCLFLFSSMLDARTYKKRRTVKPRNSTDFLNKALKDNNDQYGFDILQSKKKRKTRRYKRRYKKKRKSSRKKRSTTKKTSSSVADAVVLPAAEVAAVSDEMKLQKSLMALGYYHGAIDGEVNNFETRTAIKTMNQAFGNGNTLFLNTQVKEMLIYLADLYKFDKNLTSNDTNEESKNIKLQTALKVLGFYHDEIDGLMGPGSRGSILQYKEANNLNKDDKLDFEEEYQLVSKATDVNHQHIEEAKEGLSTTASNQSKPEKIKGDNSQVAKKDENVQGVPVAEKIQKPKSNIGLSDSFE